MTTFSVFYERREREEIVLQFDDESWFFLIHEIGKLIQLHLHGF